MRISDWSSDVCSSDLQRSLDDRIKMLLLIWSLTHGMSDRDFCPSHHIYIGLLDVSRGFEDVAERCSDQIDHGDEGMGVSVASCPGASGLEDTVERLHAGVAVGDRKSVGWGKSVSVRVDPGGGRII